MVLLNEMYIDQIYYKNWYIQYFNPDVLQVLSIKPTISLNTCHFLSSMYKSV